MGSLGDFTTWKSVVSMKHGPNRVNYATRHHFWIEQSPRCFLVYLLRWIPSQQSPQEFQVLTESSQHLLGCVAGCGSCRPGRTLEEAHSKVQRRTAQLSQRRGLSENGGVGWENQGKSRVRCHDVPWVLGVFTQFQTPMTQDEEVVATDSARDRTSTDL